MNKLFLVFFALLLAGCTSLNQTFNESFNNQTIDFNNQTFNENEFIVEVVDCGEWVDLFSKSVNISQYNNGELIIGLFNLFKESSMNITSIEFNESIHEGGVIDGHGKSYFSIPLSGFPVQYFEGEVVINFTNKNDSYQSTCELIINEDNYVFFDEVLILPGSNDYELSYEFINPLNISEINPGPLNCSSLIECINYCDNSVFDECSDWVHAIYLSLNTSNQAVINGKHNGVWLPTIDSIRESVKLIPLLKLNGVNTVSFGPDIVTKGQDYPKTVGDNLFKFYVKLFEDAGFNVNLVPNSMHYGNGKGLLKEFNSVLLNWSVIAEELNVKFFTTLNEVDGHDSNLTETNDWLQSVLPLVRNHYSGLVCAQPTARTFYTGEPGSFRLNYSGYDCISNFFSLLTYAWGMDHNYEEKDLLLEELDNVFSLYDSVKYVMPTDVAVFHGGNWAEDSIMCGYINGNNVYSNESEHYALFEFFFKEVYPWVNGSFINNYLGFTWIGTSVEGVVREYYANNVLNETWSDALWSTNGLLELIEEFMVLDEEKELIFDVYEYNAGWAGLDYEPTEVNPGPFNCTSVSDCMNLLRAQPEEYFTQSGGCEGRE